METKQSLIIPPAIVSQVDVARVMRELTAVSDFFISSQARPAGAGIVPPRLSRSLDQLAQANKANLLEESHRKQLYTMLNDVMGKAPLIHISFASEASPRALDKIIDWLRTNIHPQTLLQVGLQPNIAAGCIVRTPSKVFDLSLRNSLRSHEPDLVALISGAARQ